MTPRLLTAAIGAALLVLCISARPTHASSIEPWTEREVAVSVAGGELRGTLQEPDGAYDRHCVVILIAGSGDIDRNGNTTGYHGDHYHRLATQLAQAGVSTFRFDKRGAFENADLVGPGRPLRFNDMVDDVVTTVAYIRSIRPHDHVILVGHSEGALVAMAAAARASIDRVVLLGSPGRDMFDYAYAQAAATYDTQADREVARGILIALRDGSPLNAAYDPRFSGLLASDHTYVGDLLGLRPTEMIQRVRVPVVAVLGDQDHLSDPADLALLNAANPKLRQIVVPGMDHMMCSVRSKSGCRQIDTRVIDTIVESADRAGPARP